MTPAFRILADGADITRLFADRLLSLSVTDDAGITADAFEASLDNRDRRIDIPSAGAVLDVALGYAPKPVCMGLYTIDEVEDSGPPDTLTLRGKSADMAASLKSQKTRDWDSTTLGELVSAIAGEHGLTPACHASLADTRIEHLDQTAESDLNLLTRLAEDHGALFKPAAGHLVFCPRGLCQTPDGAPLPVIQLAATDVTRWASSLTERQFYRAVKAKWREQASSNEHWLTVGEGEPVMMLRHPYRSEAEALAAAEGKLRGLARGRSSLRLDLPGRPDLAAEHPLRITGLGPLADGDWIIQRVVHRLDASGYVSTLEAVRPDDLMADVEPGDPPAKASKVKSKPSPRLTDADIAAIPPAR